MNKNPYAEQIILEQALAALEKTVTPDFKVEVPARTAFFAQALMRPVDAFFRLKKPNQTWDFAVRIKNTVHKAERFFLYTQTARFPQTVLVTRYVNPIAAEEMKQQGIQFIDAAGNGYLNQEGLFLFIKGNRPRAEYGKIGKTLVLQAAGLKTIFALLCDPHILARTYREIAEVADVALGTVAILMKELRERGFLLGQKTDGHKLINKKELFEQWITGYVHKLRPKLALGRFQGEDRWLDQWQLTEGVWGGEVAAAKYTKYLHPEFATIYTADENVHDLVVKHRLRKDPKGNVEILRKFWKCPDPFPGLAHPIVTYADLTAIGNQRDLETARMLYDNQISRLIGEN